MTLSEEELDRYARHIVLPAVGGVGQVALRRASILIVGAGGIGNAAIPALAAAGVGRLRIVDDDTVSLSNLQRQTMFSTADIGQPKVTVVAERIAALNPGVTVDVAAIRATADTLPGLIEGCDVIIDGSDNFATRLLVSDAATRAQVQLVSAAVAQFQGQVGVFSGWMADAPCYRCFVGDAHDPEDCDSCAEQGVLGAMVGVVGAMAALEAMRIIIGFGEAPVGRLQLIDGLAGNWRSIRLPKDPGCSACAQ